MTTSTLPPHGAYFDSNYRRKALIMNREGGPWLEIYQIETYPNGRWCRNSKVSVPVDQSCMPKDILKWLPTFDQDEIPADFWLPQGKAARQMYGKHAPNFDQEALVITRRVNVKKAMGYARNIGAWIEMHGEKGVIAQFPGQEMPWFFTWKQFQIAMNTHFPVK